MAKANRVNEVVSAAVIEALEKDKSGLVAEITADVINGNDSGGGYASMAYLMGYGGGDGRTHLERTAREHIRRLAAEATTAWIDDRAEDIRAAVVSKLNADALADSYISRLLGVSADAISVSVRIESPSNDEDDD